MTDEYSTRLPIPIVVEEEEKGILPGDYLSLEARSQELARLFGFNQEILAGYLDPSSRRQYCRDFYAYLEYAGSREEALHPRTMERWVLWLVNHPQEYSPKTINRMLSAVKKIMAKAAALDYLDRATAQGFADVELVREVTLKERIRPRCDHAGANGRDHRAARYRSADRPARPCAAAHARQLRAARHLLLPAQTAADCGGHLRLPADDPREK